MKIINYLIILLMLATTVSAESLVEQDNSSIPLELLIESDHPYANKFEYTWSDISVAKATQMRLHFSKVDIKRGDSLDILDKEGSELIQYSDIKKDDLWTEWYTLNTMKLRFKTNGEDTSYGFLLDKIEVRSGMEIESEWPESYHPYPNNFEYTWQEIYVPKASQMRLHFSKIDIKRGDSLDILDKEGSELIQYSDIKKDDLWTEWYALNIMKLRFKTNGDDIAYGFKLDKVEIRKSPLNTETAPGKTSSTPMKASIKPTSEQEDTNITVTPEKMRTTEIPISGNINTMTKPTSGFEVLLGTIGLIGSLYITRKRKI